MQSTVEKNKKVVGRLRLIETGDDGKEKNLGKRWQTWQANSAGGSRL